MSRPAADAGVPGESAESFGLVRAVAVMICTRDRPRQLADCLASVAVLVPPPAGRVVVCVADNNDRPQEAAIRTQAEALGIALLYRHQPARGYASVRNTALELAAEADVDLAVFIDDDSTADPGLALEHAAAAERYAADAILGRIEGLSQRPREGHRVRKAGTGNVAIRRRVYEAPPGLGLRFDERLNLLGFEDFEFFGDLVRRGGSIYQSTRPLTISADPADADPRSRARDYALRRVFAVMEGRNEIVVTRIRHGLPAATLRVGRRLLPLAVRAIAALAVSPFAALRDKATARRRREDALLRLHKARAGMVGLWGPAYERPEARAGRLVEVAASRRLPPRAADANA